MTRSWSVVWFVVFTMIFSAGCVSTQKNPQTHLSFFDTVHYAYQGSLEVGVPEVRYFGCEWGNKEHSNLIVVIEIDRPAESVTVQVCDPDLDASSVWDYYTATHVIDFIYAVSFSAKQLERFGDDIVFVAHPKSKLSGQWSSFELYYSRQYEHAERLVVDLPSRPQIEQAKSEMLRKKTTTEIEQIQQRLQDKWYYPITQDEERILREKLDRLQCNLGEMSEPIERR